MQFHTHRPEGLLPYTVATPAGATGRLPGVLFLHGPAGPALEAVEWPAIVVMPHCPVGETWTGDVLDGAMAVLDRAGAEYPIDAVNIALTGIAMGGVGAWEAAARWPERFTRVMPVSAAARPESVAGLAGMPVWIQHGAGDAAVPLAAGRRMAELLAGTTEHLRYSEHPGAGTDIWAQLHAEPAVVDWLAGGEIGAATPPIRPIFVGGTGRSGTSTMATLIARHPDFMATPEIRLHTRAGGLVDVLNGETTPAQFTGRARGRWFYRWIPGEAPVGVHRMIDEARWYGLLDRFEEQFPERSEDAARMVLRGILDPIALTAGATGWVEHSPINVRRADVLFRLFPDMRMVHCVRDGRDTARSMTRQTWGPDSTDEALSMWAARMWEAHEATKELPPDRVLVVRWEELVERDRENQFRRVVEFLGVDEHPRMRRFFTAGIHTTGAHIGRWRTELPAAEAARIDKLYREHLDEMAAAGVTCLPIAPE